MATSAYNNGVYDLGTEFRFADRKWDNAPGGKIVKRFTENGVKYVDVEFKKSPGVIYTYYA